MSGPPIAVVLACLARNQAQHRVRIVERDHLQRLPDAEQAAQRRRDDVHERRRLGDGNDGLNRTRLLNAGVHPNVSKRCEQPLHALSDLIRRIAADHESVVLHDQRAWAVLACSALERREPVLQRLGEREAGIHEVDPENIVAQALLDESLAFPTTTELVYERCMQVNDETSRHEMVQNGLDRGSLPFLRFSSCRKDGVLEGGLALVPRAAQVALQKHLKGLAIEIHEPLRANRGQRVPAAFDQQPIVELDRGVAAAGEHQLRVRSEETRELDEYLQGARRSRERRPVHR